MDERGRSRKSREENGSRNRDRSSSRIRSEERSVIIAENQDILSGTIKERKKHHGKQEEQKANMQQLAEVTERSWLDSWLGTMQEETGNRWAW